MKTIDSPKGLEAIRAVTRKVDQQANISVHDLRVFVLLAMDSRRFERAARARGDKSDERRWRGKKQAYLLTVNHLRNLIKTRGFFAGLERRAA